MAIATSSPSTVLDIEIGIRRLRGRLKLAEAARGLVIFAHGSGSSRFSPRNTYAAARLNERGFATLLFDLLTEEESADRRNVFDISLLADRVDQSISWVLKDQRTLSLPVGLFGASTGAAAAIVAAVSRRDVVAAVVSRGGRPDLAGEALEIIAAPTLLIVGGEDRDVIALNKAAQKRMRCKTRLAIVPGAGHLFEEPGTLDVALEEAASWFDEYLGVR